MKPLVSVCVQFSKILVIASLSLTLGAKKAAKKPPPKENKIFQTDYLEFSIPKGWACNLDNTTWICRYSLPRKCYKSKERSCKAARKLYSEAIMILTAKQTGPKDSIRKYYQKLNRPFSLSAGKKKKLASKVIHTKKANIKRQTWVDSLHVGSELPNYYTRYLATVKGNVSAIITFSSHKKLYSKYSKTFFETMKTLRVKGIAAPKLGKNRKNSLLDPSVGDVTKLSNQICDGSIDPTCQSPELSWEKTMEKKLPFFKGNNKKMILLGAALFLVIIGFIIFRRTI